MTADDETVEKIKADAVLATPGDWKMFDAGQLGAGVNGVSEGSDVAHVSGFDSRRSREQEIANAAHIANCDPQTILALIARLEASEAREKRVREALEKIAMRNTVFPETTVEGYASMAVVTARLALSPPSPDRDEVGG